MKIAVWVWVFRVTAAILIAAGVALTWAVKFYSDSAIQEAAAGWLQKHRVVANSLVDESPLDQASVRWLGEVTKGSQVVGIGEPTHGSAEFFVTRRRIIEKLVEHRGFSVVALEAPVPDCVPLNRFVLEGVGTPETATSEGMSFRLWRTQGLAALVAWAREYKLRSSSDSAVEFLCFDFQPTPPSLNQVLTVLAEHNPEAAEAARQSLSLMLADRPTDLSSFSDAESRTLRTALDDLEGALASVVSTQGLSLYVSTLKEHMDLVAGPGATFWEVSQNRDRLMSNLLMTQLGDDRKGIVLAHNMHLAKSELGNFGRPSLGSFLRDELGEHYLAIAQLLVEGETWAYQGSALRTSVLTAVPVPAAPHTLGARLAGSNACAVINLQEASRFSRARLWLERPQDMRSIGVFVAVGGEGIPLLGFSCCPPLECFDAMLAVRHVSPSTPVREHR